MQTIHKTRFSKLKNNVYAFMLASGSCALLFLLLFAPKAGLDGARNGLTLCAEVVIPTLFPFLVLSAFMIKIGLADRFGRWLTPVTRFLFHLPGAAAPAIILGVLGGYPVGAKACADLVEQGSLNKEQGNRLLSFCINSSPAYIIGAVGTGLLESAEAGILLYAAHILSSLIIGIFLGRLHHTKKDATPPTPRLMNTTGIAGSLVSSVTGAASSMVGICAFVVFFSSISSLISFTGIVENTAQIISHFPLMGWFDGTSGMTFVKGFLEVSGGCEAASKNGLFVLETLSACLSWSSLSVIFQILVAVRGSGLSAKTYTLCRPLHIFLSILLTLLFFHIFPVAVPAFASSSHLSLSMHNAPASVALLFACTLFLLARASV